MVIAQVLTSFQVGGQEVMVVELATRQCARGNRVVAVTLEQSEPGPLYTAFARAGIEVVHVPKRGPGFDITLVPRLARLFRRHEVDVVHAHNHLPLIYGALAGKLNGCTVVTTRHGQDEGSPRQIWLRRQAVRLVDSFVAVSNQVANNARALKLAVEPKLTIIENGIDLGRYGPHPSWRAEARAEIGVPENARVIGTVCRLVVCKNLGLLLRSCLPHLSDELRLVIIGDGPERRVAESFAALHAHGKFVRFLGLRNDVARLLSGLDLFALSSKVEGHPIAVIEAMATGLPVLATKVGGVPEMIEDGTTGFLSQMEDTAFATRLAEALEQCHRWPEMGRAAMSVAHQRFSSEIMADRYQRIYDRA